MPYVPLHQLPVAPGVEHQAQRQTALRVTHARTRNGPISSGLATDEQLTFDAAAYYQAVPWLRADASAIHRPQCARHRLARAVRRTCQYPARNRPTLPSRAQQFVQAVRTRRGA